MLLVRGLGFTAGIGLVFASFLLSEDEDGRVLDSSEVTEDEARLVTRSRCVG